MDEGQLQGQTVVGVALQGSNGLGLKKDFPPCPPTLVCIKRRGGCGGLNTHERYTRGKKGRVLWNRPPFLSAHMMMHHHHRPTKFYDLLAGSYPSPLEWWVSKLNSIRVASGGYEETAATAAPTVGRSVCPNGRFSMKQHNNNNNIYILK
jgi:hypothetical protein